MLFDTHCHLNDEQFRDDLDEVIVRAKEAGVSHIVIPGVDVESSRRAISIAESHEGIYAAVGIHPEAANDVPAEAYEAIRQMARHPKVVAIGEIGLDYYWDTAPRPVQQEVLKKQIEVAADLGLPIVIHNRDATQDTVDLLQRECPNRGVVGVMHCFTGSYEIAVQCMKLGFYISFGGPVTFKNAKNVVEVAAKIPEDRLLIETDSPYLTPHPFRGKRNEPARVSLVAEKLAELKSVPVETLQNFTFENACRLFEKVRVYEARF
jgi:TatD DNase family protein